jgi:hypothetical protein
LFLLTYTGPWQDSLVIRWRIYFRQFLSGHLSLNDGPVKGDAIGRRVALVTISVR